IRSDSGRKHAQSARRKSGEVAQIGFRMLSRVSRPILAGLEAKADDRPAGNPVRTGGLKAYDHDRNSGCAKSQIETEIFPVRPQRRARLKSHTAPGPPGSAEVQLKSGFSDTLGRKGRHRRPRTGRTAS